MAKKPWEKSPASKSTNAEYVGREGKEKQDEDNGSDGHTARSFSVAEKVCVLLNPI